MCETDVFTDFAENVIVGEATGIAEDDELVTRATINKTIIQPSTDPRIPAGPPINSFGFAIDPTRATDAKDARAIGVGVELARPPLIFANSSRASSTSTRARATAVDHARRY